MSDMHLTEHYGNTMAYLISCFLGCHLGQQEVQHQGVSWNDAGKVTYRI